jgi:hypothetical protein
MEFNAFGHFIFLRLVQCFGLISIWGLLNGIPLLVFNISYALVKDHDKT